MGFRDIIVPSIIKPSRFYLHGPINIDWDYLTLPEKVFKYLLVFQVFHPAKRFSFFVNFEIKVLKVGAETYSEQSSQDLEIGQTCGKTTVTLPNNCTIYEIPRIVFNIIFIFVVFPGHTYTLQWLAC